MLTFVREIEFSDLENMTVETFQVFARRISKGISHFISAPAKPALSNNALAKPASITIEIKSLKARHMVELSVLSVFSHYTMGQEHNLIR